MDIVDYKELVEKKLDALKNDVQAIDCMKRVLFVKHVDRDDGFMVIQHEEEDRYFEFNVTVEPWQALQVMEFLRNLPSEPESPQ